MKTPLQLAGFLLCALPVSAAIPVGRGEIGVGLTAAETYDSNLYGNPTSAGDYYASFTPALTYARNAAVLKVTAGANLSFLRYAKQTQLNADNPGANFNVRYDTGEDTRLSGAVGGSYFEGSDVNPDLNTRVRTKSTTFTAQGSLVTGPRTDVSANGNYNNVVRSVGSDQRALNSGLLFHYNGFLGGYNLRLSGDYDRTTTSGDNALNAPIDQTSYQTQVGLERRFESDLHIWFGYGFRILDRSAAETASGNTQMTTPVFTLSLDGPILPQKYFPKVKSSIVLDYSNSATPGINDNGDSKVFTGRLNFDWQAREFTTVGLAFVRSQRLSANDLSVVSSSVQLSLTQRLRYNLNGTLTAAYDWEKYRNVDRADRIFSVTAGLDYSFAERWTAGLALRANQTTSNLAGSDYDRYVTTVRLGYSF
ncbi:MAG: outer membrane beta-barrel protein [Opitutaceae bacterium]